ncbi:glycerophosphodiester phosphodiesterase family protein [Rheinheimera baltica]|uniref:glycerophosphodiester phosphodiesterase family protein n=1 Tax=Rheinheimera baltica TaxID=67576 RepID=UPI00273DEB86|nr:glycerophosphodiester phosphodiesterase family protein [Rheinheimera baltica]MDP5190057.1 glycerophosphodiester phosphodiesterase family protein [Rheinheimera baltica]
MSYSDIRLSLLWGGDVGGMMKFYWLLIMLMLLVACQGTLPTAQPGVRPIYLLQQLPESDLQQRLQACQHNTFYRSDFSIAHRGAPLMFPEHSLESYQAAITMGAGMVECDVAFTADQQLVCRHAQCDLHQTTDILLRPTLAEKCSQPFVAADPTTGTSASARCCTSDITVAEFSSLCAKMDGVNTAAQQVADYVKGTPVWRTELYTQCAKPMTHQESVALFKQQGVKMVPELKQAEVPMPFNSRYSQQQYAQQLVDDYKASGVPPSQVYLQSFNWQDIEYWLTFEPEFGRQAIWLDERYEQPGFDAMKPDSWQPSMQQLKDAGLNIIAPPLWVLVTEQKGKIVPSRYALAAKAAGLKIIAWSLERSAPLKTGGDWYYQSLPLTATDDSAVLQLLDVLAQDVGVIGVFSDWPATTTYYANCLLNPKH